MIFARKRALTVGGREFPRKAFTIVNPRPGPPAVFHAVLFIGSFTIYAAQRDSREDLGIETILLVILRCLSSGLTIFLRSPAIVVTAGG